MALDAFPAGSTSAAMQAAIEYARRVAATPYPVLLTGETGTGKDVLARAIHAASRRPGAFAPVNCAAIPEHLFEAELFGAERGAYTGLDTRRDGMFRLADRGTLFLDEIAEMPLAAQAKLLRVLQDGEVRPLGSTTAYKAAVRIVAATHRDLARAVETGAFRMDLYFRISAATIALPPLRERPQDLPRLMTEAIAEAARVQGVAPHQLTPSAIAYARSHDWPGNIRELIHAVASAMLRAGDRPLTGNDFTEHHRGIVAGAGPRIAEGSEAIRLPFAEAQARFERGYFASLFDDTQGNLTKAATIAGLARSTLREKLRRHGIAQGSTPTPAVKPPPDDD